MANVMGAAGLCGVKISCANIWPNAGIPTGCWGWLGTMPYGRNINIDRQYGMKPQAGAKDALGNRGCYHLHYTGQARITPPEYSTNTSVSGSTRYCWICKNTNPSKRLVQMNASTSSFGNKPADLCGGRVQFKTNVGRDKTLWPYLWPRYYIQSIEAEASCSSGKIVQCTVTARLKSTQNSAYKKYTPEEGTAKGSCTLDTTSGRSQTVKCTLQWTDSSGAQGTIEVSFTCRTTNTFVVGEVNPELAWIQSRGFVREIWTLPSLVLAHGRIRDEKLPDLAVSGMNHLQEVTINSLAYTRDLTRLRADAKKLVKTLRKVKNPRSWPDLWLSYRYGFRLFYNDTCEIVEAAKKYRKRKAFQGSIRRTHSSSSSSTVTPYGDKLTQRVGLTIYSDERSLSERSAIHAASSLDLLPSLNNLWDFVPYSFVLDWVIPVGDYLERLDTSAAIWAYPIRSAVVTVRSDLSVTLPPNWGGAINYTLFTRTRYSQAQLSRRAAQLPSGMLSGLSLKHGIDTLCLAVQRFKR